MFSARLSAPLLVLNACSRCPKASETEWCFREVTLQNGQMNKDYSWKLSKVNSAFLKCIGFPTVRVINLFLQFNTYSHSYCSIIIPPRDMYAEVMGRNELGGCCSSHPAFPVSGKSLALLLPLAAALCSFRLASPPSTPKINPDSGFILI